MGLLSRHKREKTKAEELYQKIDKVFCPYFNKEVIFNSDGFHHLQFSAGSERRKEEQLLKFDFLRFAEDIIKNSGTIQTYRKQWGVVGRKANGQMKEMEYWGLIALLGDNHIGVKVVLRRVGDGNITFWSVMPSEEKDKTKTDETLLEK